MTSLAILDSQLTNGMTSLEVAVLTGKRHDNAMRDIRNILLALNKDALKFRSNYFDKYGRQKPCFKLPKDLTFTLLMGYSAKLRSAIITRIHELEEQLSKPKSLSEALLEAAQRAELHKANAQQSYISALEAHIQNERQRISALKHF